MKKWLVNFIMAKNAALAPSEAERKMIILRGILAGVGILAGIAYIFIDHINSIYGNEPYYIACSLISVATLVLVRAGRYQLSTILSVSVMNFLIFLFSASESPLSGIYIFFVANSLTALTLFGYRDRKIALLFVAVAIALFSVSYWTEHPWLPKRVFDLKYTKLEFSINFIISLITCIAIVYFLIDVNFHSEKQILAKNEQLAKANSELDRFVYSASHDMRAPLSSILGLVQVYKLSSSSEEKDKVVELIQNRANKLDEFIREILDYSRNSRLDVTLKPTDPEALVKETIDGLHYAKDFEKVNIEIEPHDPIIVSTDGDRVRVILNNILGNAIKYHDAFKTDPHIRIKFEKLAVTWSITIEDNGIGIPPDHQARVFDMFYRAHDRSEGSGLGLYIAREAAERLGGAITVTSEFTKGTVFKLEFPAGNAD